MYMHIFAYYELKNPELTRAFSAFVAFVCIACVLDVWTHWFQLERPDSFQWISDTWMLSQTATPTQLHQFCDPIHQTKTCYSAVKIQCVCPYSICGQRFWWWNNRDFDGFLGSRKHTPKTHFECEPTHSFHMGVWLSHAHQFSMLCKVLAAV